MKTKNKPFYFPKETTDKRKTIVLSIYAMMLLSDKLKQNEKFADIGISRKHFAERETETSRTEMYFFNFVLKNDPINYKYCLTFTFTIQDGAPIINFFELDLFGDHPDWVKSRETKLSIFETVKPDFMKICNDLLTTTKPIETV
jgi:hypothetical protein